jgi:hypothetical protein
LNEWKNGTELEARHMFSENDFNKILVGIQSNLKQKNTKYYMSALGLEQSVYIQIAY